MIPLTNYDFQWGRSEVVIIYPEISNTIFPAKKQHHVGS